MKWYCNANLLRPVAEQPINRPRADCEHTTKQLVVDISTENAKQIGDVNGNR